MGPYPYTCEGQPVAIEFPAGGEHIKAGMDRGWYEQVMLRDARHRLAKRPPGLAIDVGAYCGTHSLYFALACQQHVLAIEPNVPAFVALQRNLTSNHITGAIPVPLAAGSSEGWGELVEGPPHNSGMASVNTARHGGVWVQPLDSILAGYRRVAEGGRRVTVLKVDVEGMELEVLAGAAGLLTEYHPLLYVESPAQAAAVQAMLEPYGYQPFGVFNATPTYGYEVPGA